MKRQMLALVILLTTDVRADEVRVPQDFPSIQAAIDNSLDGDTILVDPGVYPENLVVMSRELTLASTGGAKLTIVDGGGVASVVSIVQLSVCTIHGFTLRNGNSGSGFGGGIRVDNSIAVIRDNVITGNVAVWGGGIDVVANQIEIVRNRIHDNSAENGGGIYLAGTGSGLVENNTVADNTAGEVTFDLTGGRGGGMFTDFTNLEVRNNLFVRNHAANPGVNNGTGGGHYRNSGANVALSNNTFSQNSADGAGGAIASPFNSLLVNSCIIYGNPSPAGELNGTVIDVSYSNVLGGWPGVGNIDTPPLFVTGAAGHYYLSQTAAGQADTSPCVDAGDPARTAPDGTTRTDEEPDSSTVDMGFHFQPTTKFVRSDCNESGDVDLADAIFTLDVIFLGGGPASCAAACDSNGDDVVDISDAVFLLSWLFVAGSPEPTEPFPACGPNRIPSPLGCEHYDCP